MTALDLHRPYNRGADFCPVEQSQAGGRFRRIDPDKGGHREVLS